MVEKQMSQYISFSGYDSEKTRERAEKGGLYELEGIDIYSQDHLEDLRYKFNTSIKDDMYRMVRAFPTYKLYFVEEDAEQMMLWDDLYSYNSVSSIEIHKSKENAADTAVVTVSNFLGNLDRDVRPKNKEKLHLTQSGSVVEDQPEIEKMRLKSGIKIQIKMGYSSNVGELDIVFNGKITDIEYGDMVTFHASGYGAELLHPKGWDYRRGYRRGKEAVPLNVMRRMMDYPEVQNFGKRGFGNPLDGAKMMGDDVVYDPRNPWRTAFISLMNSPREDNIYIERSNRFWNTVNFLREYRVANTTPWGVFQEMARLHPGYVAAVVPYDQRATLFFGLPDQPYYWTSGQQVPYMKEAMEKWRNNKAKYNYLPVESSGIGINGRKLEYKTEDKINLIKSDPNVTLRELESLVRNQKTYPEKFISSKRTESSWIKIIEGKTLTEEERRDIEYSLKNEVTGGRLGRSFKDLAIRIIKTEPKRFSEIFKVDWTADIRGFIIELKDIDNSNLFTDKRGNIVTENMMKSNIGLSPRQRPFRNYHYKDAMHHIVSNNIKISLEDFHNTVVVESPVNIWRRAKSQQGEMARVKSAYKLLCADKDIPEEWRRTIVVRENNIETNSQALKCALSHLKNETSKLYQGELVVLGDPKIKPHDIVFIYDTYTDMYGPIEVREVVHSFSEDTGFVTTIIPDMVVNVNNPTGIRDLLYNALVFSGIVVLGIAMTAALGPIGAKLAWSAGGATGMYALRNIGKDFFPLFYEDSGTRNISRKAPIKLCPLVYDGKPFIAGFEGKDKGNWNIFTTDGFKRGWSETIEGARVNWVKIRNFISVVRGRGGV